MFFSMNAETQSFILEHENDNTSSLFLAKGNYPEVDIEAAVHAIEARRKVRTKIPVWYEFNDIEYPSSLSVEQCSSQATALYKQNLVKGWGAKKILDLTTGLGVDSFFFSMVAESLTCLEKRPELASAAKHNFKTLERYNIEVVNTDCLDYLAECSQGFDLIYADPARRSATASRVFAIEDCEPDIARLMPRLLELSPLVMVKLSPMLDITATLERLPQTSQLHIVCSKGECKECLAVAERGAKPEKCGANATIHAVYLERGSLFRLTLAEEKEAEAVFATEIGRYLYQPGKEIMKAGAFKLVSQRYGLGKLEKSTHLYTGNELCADFPGKTFEVIETLDFSSGTIKRLSSRYPKANLVSLNMPMSTDTLRARLHIADGGEIHIFACNTQCRGKSLIICRKTAI